MPALIVVIIGIALPFLAPLSYSPVSFLLHFMRTNLSPWTIFFLVAVAQFMVVLDVSITNVALPAIQTALHFDPQALQWVITSYALTFGGFLLLGGRASDLFGHRLILMVGLGLFTLISFLIGLSPSSTMLVVLRALQGMAAALMAPSSLSLVLIYFPEGPLRNKALGYWSTISTAGAAVGLLLGGVLTQFLGWRMNFFVNVPIGIGIIIALAKYLPAHDGEEGHTNLDLPGAFLVTSGLTLFVYVVSQAPVWGWLHLNTLLWGALAIGLILAFVWNEARHKHPLMPLSIFRIRNITGANLMMAPIVAGMFGMFFLTSLYVQNVLQYSPVMTGLCFLPFPLIMGVLSPRVAPYVFRFGFKRFLIAGPLLVAVSMAWLVRLPVEGNYWIDILPTLIGMPLGLCLTFMPMMIAATSGVTPDKSGLASGLINTSQQMGGALGLAILSSIAASVTASHIAEGEVQALVTGYHYAFFTGMLFILVATVLGAIIIREQKPAEDAGAMAVSAH
jgi:EmrB/QacA subfamily drug resistance transporter